MPVVKRRYSIDEVLPALERSLDYVRQRLVHARASIKKLERPDLARVREMLQTTEFDCIMLLRARARVCVCVGGGGGDAWVGVVAW